MFKKEIIIVLLNVTIIGIFGLIAVGSASQSDLSSDSRRALVIFSCTVEGYKAIGKYSVSECPQKCLEAGYAKYCTGEEAGWCYCK